MITLRDGTEVTEDEFYSWSSRKQRGQLIGISDEQKVKLSAAHLGKKLTSEHKANIAIASSNRTGTPEGNEKIAASKRGKPLSDTAKANMVKAWEQKRIKGTATWTMSDEGKANMRAAWVKRKVAKLAAP